MRRIKLNMSALRGRCTARTRAEGAAAQPGAATLSRRDWLKATGAAFSLLSPAVGAVGAALQGPFEFVAGGGRAAFKLGDKERWVIDVRRFGGRPRLSVEHDAHLISLTLADALFPGTDLRADMACEIQRRLGGWLMKLRLSLGGFACEASFEEWLAGGTVASARVQLDAPACELGARGSLAVSGVARSEFSPDWSLTFDGSGVGRVPGLGAEILSDSVRLSLLGHEQPSLTNRRAPKRTLISLKRGGRSWPFEPETSAADGWKLTTTERTFDVIHIEAGESMRGARTHALLAESDEKDDALTFQPSAHLTDGDSEPFALRLRSPRYAVAFDPAGDQTALVARFAEEPVWLRHRGVGVQLGDAADAPPFELMCLGGRVESLKCSPALLSFAAPLPGAVVEPARAAGGGLFTFELGAYGRGRRTPDAQPPQGRLRLDPRPSGEPDISLSVEGFLVPVLRPADLLALTFEFKNFTLVESGSSPFAGRKLQRTDKGDAFIIVRFPPQHIAEEVFDDIKGDKPIARRVLPRFIPARFQQLRAPNKT